MSYLAAFPLLSASSIFLLHTASVQLPPKICQSFWQARSYLRLSTIMVKLTQIDDETANTFEQAPQATKEQTYSDSESDSDSDEDDFDENETLFDRVVALKDIVPPQQRTQIASGISYVQSLVNSGATKTGSLLWTLTSSALLLGVPLSLAILAETQLQEMEKEMQLQQSAQDVLAPGSEGAYQAPEQK